MERLGWAVWSDQCLEVCKGSSVDRLVGQYHCLESDASYYMEPAEVTEKGFWICCEGLLEGAGSPSRSESQ